MLFLAKLVFDHRPYEISLGGRLLNTTETNKSMNRQHNKSPPCSSPNPTNDDLWPRFLIVEAADDNTQPLTKRCKIFALNIAIKGMGGNDESVQPLNGGRQLLVHFENKIYSKNLLETKELANITVKVSPHRTLNYSRCVLFCKELAGIEEEEIKNQLASQGVVKVERMKRKKDGQLIPADSYILAVHGQKIPSKIKVGYLTKNYKKLCPKSPKMLSLSSIWTQQKILQQDTKMSQLWSGNSWKQRLQKCSTLCKLQWQPSCVFKIVS